MEQDIKEEILKKIEKMGKGTILLHGGWGIGKTFLAKEYIYDQWEKRGKNVLYFDARGIEALPSYQEAILTILQSFKDNKKRHLVWGLNAGIWFVNGLLKTSFGYLKIDDKQAIIDIKTKTKEEIILIIDEIDRISGESILKVLNLINILKITYQEKVKILAIGNEKEINSVLMKSLGLENGNGFIEKYFENKIDISEIERKAAFEILENSKYSFLLKTFTNGFPNEISKAKINPRRLKRFLQKIRKIKSDLSNELIIFLFIYWLFLYQKKGIELNFSNRQRISITSNEIKLLNDFWANKALSTNSKEWLIDYCFKIKLDENIDILKKLFLEYGLENFDNWYELIEKIGAKYF